MSELYVCTGAFKSGSLPAIARECAALGITGLELSSGIPWHPALEQEIAALRETPLHLLVHNYFPPPEVSFVLNLASTDPGTLALSKAHVRRAVVLSQACAASFYSVHSGFALNMAPSQLGDPQAQARLEKIPHAAALAIFRESLRELVSFAREHGIRLLIENNVLAANQVTPGEPHPLLMVEPGEIAAFFREFGDPTLGLLLDTGHAKVAAASLGFDPLRFLDELFPYIAALHLSDNDGTRDNNQPSTPSSWFMPHLYRFSHLPQVIEAYRLDHAEIAGQLALFLDNFTACMEKERP